MALQPVPGNQTRIRCDLGLYVEAAPDRPHIEEHASRNRHCEELIFQTLSGMCINATSWRLRMVQCKEGRLEDNAQRPAS